MSTTVQPTTDDIDQGKILTDSRTGDELLLVYLDERVALVRDRQDNHRLERRHQFEQNVEMGRYKHAPDAEPFDDSSPMDEEIAFEELDAVGEAGAANLREKGIVTRGDVLNASDEEILDTGWIGAKGLASIKDEVQ